jgi:hypothetical protein
MGIRERRETRQASDSRPAPVRLPEVPRGLVVVLRHGGRAAHPIQEATPTTSVQENP